MGRWRALRAILVLSAVLGVAGPSGALEGPAPDGQAPMPGAPFSPTGPQGAPPPALGPDGAKPPELPRAEIREETGTIRLGAVTIDPRKREVSLPCAVNMREGLLEYALVGETGKRHESLLWTEVEPYNLQVALLLLGLKGGASGVGQGDAHAPQGDPVQLWVEWSDGGEAKRARLESWVARRLTPGGELGPVGEMNWVFTGSRVVEGVFLAQVERSIVAIYRDSTAMIDNPLPEGADDTVWFANPKAAPPVGTRTTLVIRGAN